MKEKNFYLHQELASGDLGYGQFSKKHLSLIFLVCLSTIIYSLIYINCDINIQIIIRKIIAITLLILEIIKQIVLYKTPVKQSDYLPLEICSLAAYLIMFDALLPTNRLFIQVLLTLFLPAALMAIIFPTTVKLPIFNFFTIHQFLFHALIIQYIIACLINREISINYLSFWKSLLIVVIIVFFVYIIDTIFNKNFMFLKDTYDNSMLKIIENKTGKGYKYTLGLVLFAIIVTNIFYLIMHILFYIFKL